MYVYVELKDYDNVEAYTLMEGEWPLPLPEKGEVFVSDGNSYTVHERQFVYTLDNEGDRTLTVNLSATKHGEPATNLKVSWP